MSALLECDKEDTYSDRPELNQVRFFRNLLTQIELPNIFFFNQNDIITYANEVCKPVKAFMATRVWPDLRAVLKYLQYVVAKRQNDNQNELLMLLKATQSLVLVATMARDPIIGGIT